MKGMDAELTIFKLLAFGFMGIYMYKAMRKNGGTLAGNPYGIRLRSDKLVDTVLPLLNLNHEQRVKARELGIRVVDKYVKGQE
jgi:hypothetical protein